MNSVVATNLKLPDFAIIGGSKSGTHWLNECLREHPEVFVTRDVHEIFFFDRYFDRGVEWYARYFREWSGQKRTGDVTPTYLAHPDAPLRMKQVMPDATLIIQLRNPVSRAHSKYLHMWRKGDIESRLTFRQACEAAPEIVVDGEFGRWITHWHKFFPRDHFRYLVLDDAKADPFAYLRRLYELLGVNPDFRASLTADKTNEHQTPRSLGLARVAFRFSRFLHSSGLHWAVDALKAIGLKRMILKPGRDKAKDPPPLSEEDRLWLANRFRDDAAVAGDIVGRDLRKLWLDTPAEGTKKA